MKRGWFRESARHALAAKGIKTSTKLRNYNKRLVSFIGASTASLGIYGMTYKKDGLTPRQYLAGKGRFTEFVERQKLGARRAQQKHPIFSTLTKAELIALGLLSGAGGSARIALPAAFTIPAFFTDFGRPKNGQHVDNVPVRMFRPLGIKRVFVSRKDDELLDGHRSLLFKDETEARTWLDEKGYVITAKGKTNLTAKELDKKMKKQSAAYRGTYDDMVDESGLKRKQFTNKYFHENAKLDDEYTKALSSKPITSELSERYKKYWLTSSGITKPSIDNLISKGKVSVAVLGSKAYDSLPEERLRFAKGEMSYAQTKITPSHISITIRKTPNKKVMQKLLRHEREELSAFKTLKHLNIPESVDVAHELTKTKVTNSEVDKAYGDIGDPT